MSLLDNKNIMKQLEGMEPRFQQHVMVKNHLVEEFALEKYGTIDLLDLPMCTKCEKPCTWHTDDTAYHMECGTTIKQPITMREYLSSILKFSDEQLDILAGFLFKPDDILKDLGLKRED